MEVNRGYKQTEVGVIPEDWDVIKLVDIGECLIGLTYSPSNVKTDGTLVLRSSNVQNGSLSFKDNVYVDAEIPQRIRVINGDILVCVRNGSRALIGKSALLDKRVEGQTFGAFMSVYRTKDFGYIFQQFQSALIKRQINENIGATINQITNRNLNSFKVPFPTDNSERKAIAAALSDVDALFAAQEKLITKKRDIKQAAMQQLLTGKNRLPGFSGEWQVKQLGNVCQIKTGKKDVNEGNAAGQYPFFTCAREHTFSDSFSFEGEAILIAGNGEVGNLNYINGKFEAYQRTYVLQDFTTHVSYLWHQMTASLAKSLGIGKIGSSIPYIKMENLVEFEFCYPIEVTEQIAIANILSDIDSELVTLEQQRDKIRAIKAGMMQELLSGKIRLV